jgi:tetratricopeptide (TPR) repeat protein
LEVPIIRTDDQYDKVVRDVEKLSKASLEKADDAPLTIQEEHDLRVAAIKVKGLIGFLPQRYNNYLLAGRISFLLQDYPTAQVYFYQCLQQPWTPDLDKDVYIESLANAHYMISKCLFLQHIYQKAADEAQIASRYEPQSDQYKFAEAEAEAQLGHDKAAIGILKDAYKINPKNTRIQALYAQIMRSHEEEAKKTAAKKSAKSAG